MKTDITLVLTNTYDNWSRVRRGPKRAHLGCAKYARTGSNMLAGPVKKLLTDDQMYYNHKAAEFAFREAVNLDTMAVVNFAICPCK
ncbi:MAG: hypothetical protein ACETWQ_20265 [Phycisphaerae bacterium]